MYVLSVPVPVRPLPLVLLYLPLFDVVSFRFPVVKFDVAIMKKNLLSSTSVS